jgi:hypothetical protein
VSCPAVPEAGDYKPPFPRTIPVSERRRTEIGVRFIVDTSGAIERQSIEFLPGTNARFGAAARRDMRMWRYRRAERDGIPVRQIVQTRLVFEPEGGDVNLSPYTITPSATDDGWVLFRHASNFPTQLPIREWYTPDSVDAWVRRVKALHAEAASLARTAARDTEKTTSLGSGSAIQFSAGYRVYAGTVQSGSGYTACGDAYSAGERPIEPAVLAQMSAAARAARSRRAKPASPSTRVFLADEVACPAWLRWSRDANDPTTRLWRFPTGVYPSTMARDNARAEVLVSFVVDVNGVPDRTTLQVIGGADPRAVAALPATLDAFRFRPATRGGRKVAQRVIQTILFEPPPVCAHPAASPACRPVRAEGSVAKKHGDD